MDSIFFFSIFVVASWWSKPEPRLVADPPDGNAAADVRAFVSAESGLQLVLVQEGAAASADGLLGRGEAGQRDDLDRLLLLAAAVSVQGVVELRPAASLVQFVLFGHGPAQRVAPVQDPHAHHVGFGCPGEAVLQAAEGGHGVDAADGGRGNGNGGGGGGDGAVGTGLLELGQGWGHPAAVRVAQDQALLGAGLGGLGQSFLQVHLDGCRGKKGRREGGMLMKAVRRRREKFSEPLPVVPSSRNNPARRPTLSEKEVADKCFTLLSL